MKRPVTLPDIERFLRITKMSPSRLGREAVNDPRLVADLQTGAQLGASREERIAVFLEDYARRQRDLAEQLKGFLP